MQDFKQTVPVVFSRADGDVEVAWVATTQGLDSAGCCRSGVRRFRAHLGHVVEVTEPAGRLMRIGPGLQRQGCLRVSQSLEATIEGALEAVAQPSTASQLANAPAESECGAGDARNSALCQALWPLAAWWRVEWLTSRLPHHVPFLGRSAKDAASHEPGTTLPMEEIEMLLHYPTNLGDVGIARCGRGGYCVVWRRQVIGCFADQQTAIDKAALGETSRPRDCVDLAQLRLPTSMDAWLHYPRGTRIEATRTGLAA